MPRQILSDAAARTRTLVRQVGEEILKEPGRIVGEAGRSVVAAPQENIPEPNLPQGTASTPPEPRQTTPTDANLAAARAKIRSFAQKRAQEWQRTEIQAQQAQQKRVQQIIESQLGQAPAPEAATLTPPKGKEKGKGVLGELKDFFKGKRSRKMGVAGLGQAKKQASGEFNKSQQ